MLLDCDIRESLFDFLDYCFGANRIIEEKVMGKSRADAVMVTPDAIYGIEIKSDADTYARLQRQVKDYDRFFDYNIVVVGTTHAAHIREHIPKHWGVITVDEVDGRPDFYFYVKPKPNPLMKPKKKLSLLWRSELSSIQAKNGMPRYPGKSKAFVVDKIIERMNYPVERKGRICGEELMQQVCAELMERDYSLLRGDEE